MSDFTNFSLEFLTDFPLAVWFTLAALIALSVYQYFRTNPPLTPPMRYLLIGLRTLALLALFLTLLDPVISFYQQGVRRPRLSTLIDVSGSMRLAGDSASRLRQTLEALDSPEARETLDRYERRRYFFADSLLPSPQADSGGATALGEALWQLARQEISAPADVWLVISDGLNNLGRDPRQALKEIQLPLNTIGVGSAVTDFDLEVVEVSYNPVAYVGAPTPVKALVRWRGAPAGAGEARIVLSVGQRLLASARVSLGEGELSQEVELTFTPQSPGAQIIDLRFTLPGAELSPGDSTRRDPALREQETANNSRSFSVKVLKEKVQALLVSSALDWDYKFIKRALLSNERLELTEALSVGGGQDVVFPASQSALNSYDLVILHNPSGEEPASRYQALSSFVAQRGGGLFILLGDRYVLGGFGKANTGLMRGLDSLLPFRTSERSSFFSERPTAIVPLAERLQHPALRINSGESVRESWSKFAPLEFHAPLTVPAEGALALAESDLDSRSGRRSVLLSARTLGAGKVFCVNGGPLWRLPFQAHDGPQAASRFAEFVNGALNWLTIEDDLSPIEALPERRIYARGEEIVFRGRALDETYQPLLGAQAEVSLFAEDTPDTLLIRLQSSSDGQLRGGFSGAPPGEYRFEARISDGTTTLSLDTGRIRVTEFSLESQISTPNFSLLRDISSNTGGTYMHISDLSQLPRVLPGDKIRFSHSREISLHLDLVFLLLFIVALALEWGIRKRRQLL